MSSKYLVLVSLLSLVVAAGCKKSQAAEEPTTQGRELFANACSRCHGSDGTGGFPQAAGLPSPRNFRDHGFQASHTDEQIEQTIQNGKGTAMPAFGATFDPAQRKALVRMVRSFDPEK